MSVAFPSSVDTAPTSSRSVASKTGPDTTVLTRRTLMAARLLLVVALLGAPLAFGAEPAWAWGSISLVACLSLVLWAIESARQRVVRLAWSPLYLPAAAFMLIGAVQLFGRLTLDAPGTRESLLKLASDLVIFFVATQLWSERKVSALPRGLEACHSERSEESRHLRNQANGQILPSGVVFRKPWRPLGLVVTVYTCLLALLAILQFFSSRGLIYWKVKTPGWTFGPYVNHNHYAGLMEMLIPVAAAYVLSRPRNRRGNVLLGLAVLLPAASVLLSGSRGGVFALLCELAVLAAVVGRQASRRVRRRLVAAVLLGVAAAAALFFWLDTGEMARRLETLAGLTHSPEATLADRLVVAHDSLRIFREHPWLGTGLGSFEAVYPQYQSFASDSIYDHAHNDYAEALAETGLPGGLAILVALVLFLRRTFGNLGARLVSDSGWIQFGAALGCLGLAVHSFGDFNLHIPANAAWFAALLGISEASRL